MLSMPRLSKGNIMVGVLFLAWITGYFDKAAINIAAIPISEEFHLQPDEMGMIISAFFAGYSLMQLVGGYLVDRIGSRLALSSAVAWWSVATMICALPSSLYALAAARFAVGAGEAVFPSGSSMAIAEAFPSDKMARAKGVVQSGASVGFAVGSIVISSLIVVLGWRLMFVALGVIGLVLAIALAVVMGYTTQRKSQEERAANAPKGEKKRLADIVANRTTWAITVCYFMTNIVFWGLQSWLPTYWVKVKGMSMVSMGAYSVVPPTLGFVSFVVCGWLLDRYFHRRERYLIMIGASVSALFIYLMANADSIPLAFFYLTVSNVFLNAISISVFVAIMKNYPKDSIGTATGLINSLAALGSFASPMLVGYILKVTNNDYKIAFTALIACAVAACIAAAVMRSSHHHDVSVTEPKAA
jgi:MFS family permease